ncbi:hypothetical protein MANES_12G058105v8 [Manihot esculenta]|uniref:Uncharacterized protein n=1 Tax=Manihot esculenta TaxID=3983 RepID=A0ACB7GQ46_MANES|nr:hypothetical protein MANES_12G058105v8 [Manihot esculenta]
MVRLFLSEPNRKEDGVRGDSVVAKQWISHLNQLESLIWSLMTAGGAEARLWLCSTISGITSLTSRQQRDLFVNLLRTRPTNHSLASQLLQMIFEKQPRKAGPIIAKRSYMLEKFFAGNPKRIMQWFSNFANGELEWKGKHGQSPALVATRPHYFLDLDVQRTVENFLDNVPEFSSSTEFAESLRDGDILFIDTKYFVEFFVGLMYKEDSRDVWEVISQFLMNESFSFLCNRLLITLGDRELFTVLELLHAYLSMNMEPVDFGNSSCWLEFALSRFNDCESFEQLLLLNAVINQGRQLLRLVHDEESQEEQTKIKDIVSQTCTISSTGNILDPLLNECFKMKTTEAIMFLGLQSWVIHYALSDESRISESWESLFSNNGISFQKSYKYAMLHHVGLSEESDYELDNLLDLDTSNNQLGLQSKAGSWLLSTDGFSASWTDVS